MYQEITFYADMRGTKITPIYVDPVPLMYWFYHGNHPNWKLRRVVKHEMERLWKYGVRFRFSDEFSFEDEPFEETCVIADTSDGVFDWLDGYCGHCGADFKDEGIFCSDDCENEYDIHSSPICQICRQPIVHNQKLHWHHVSYFPERKVPVHNSCHPKIHRTEDYPKLTPPPGDAKKFYGWP